MKTFFAALATALLFIPSVALAAFEESVEDDADLSKVKKMAIAIPEFYKVSEREPTLEELTKDLCEAGKMASTLEIISYEDVVSAIRRDTGIDINSLEPAEAEKYFQKNVGRYAEAYLVLTVANNSGKPWLFYYVYNAENAKLMYAYSVQSRTLGHSAKDYFNTSKDFFKHFDEVAPKKLSKEERKLFEAKQKEIRKERGDRYNYQIGGGSGRHKEELVRKK